MIDEGFQLVAFVGPAGAGKSAAAQVLTDDGYKQVKIASPLKAMLRAFYKDAGLSRDETERRIEGDLKETPCEHLGGKTPRFAMQTLGFEWGRQMISEDIWVNVARRRVKNQLEWERRIVLDDVRFANEAAMVRELGGVVVGITGRKSAVAAHASENVPTPDFIVPNDGSPEDFASEVAYSLLCDVSP